MLGEEHHLDESTRSAVARTRAWVRRSAALRSAALGFFLGWYAISPATTFWLAMFEASVVVLWALSALSFWRIAWLLRLVLEERAVLGSSPVGPLVLVPRRVTGWWAMQVVVPRWWALHDKLLPIRGRGMSPAKAVEDLFLRVAPWRTET